MKVADILAAQEKMLENDVPLADMRMELLRSQVLELFSDMAMTGLLNDYVNAEYKQRMQHPGATVEDVVVSLMHGMTLYGVLITVIDA